MRREDLFLRGAAKRGDPAACLEIASRLFSGDGGFPRNFKLGLAYLQQELQRNSQAALLLAGDSVPLEVLVAQDARELLEMAAACGSALAEFKLGTWCVLEGSRRQKGIQHIQRSGQILCADTGCFSNATEFAGYLVQRVPRAWLDPRAVFLSEVARSKGRQEIGDALFCLAGAHACDPEIVQTQPLAEFVAQLVLRVASEPAWMTLPVRLVERCLLAESELGNTEVQYAIGSAYAGLNFQRIPAEKLVQRRDLKRAMAWLLRAADAGKPDAWLGLFHLTADCRSFAGNKEAARFYLEKAARAGLLEAQRILGALLLKEADSLEKAEQGVSWLAMAAEQNDTLANELLETLHLPLPTLPDAVETSILQRVRAVDEDLGLRIALARAFRLTRRESINFDAKRDIRPWGILIPGTYTENPKGRLVPAVSKEMREELRRASSFFRASSPLYSGASQMAKAQREVFEALSIPEAEFFAPEIGRSLTHYGFGRHWAARAQPLLHGIIFSERKPQANSHSI